MLNKMIALYNEKSAADSYIIGFIKDHNLYMVKMNHMPNECLKLEKASRNQGDNLRLRIRKNAKANLLNMNAVCIGSESDLVIEKYNKGEAFEKIVTEYFGQEWHKDNVPFWEDGDITINDEKIQIKLDGATLMNSKHMARFI